MASQGLSGLREAIKALSLASPVSRTAALPARAARWNGVARHGATTKSTSPWICKRSMATEATETTEAPASNITKSVAEPWQPVTSVPVTIYSFPSLEPRSVESWSAKHLHLPLRRDILHLAVVYEGDKTRQGTASSKTRWEVAGSHRKIQPQKGLGRARVGTRQSPLRRGGGKSFGPKPRDFSTRLNRKVYDLAWRTALSWRYRRGELVVTQDGLELPLPDDFLQLAEAGRLGRELEDGYAAKYVRQMMEALRWDKAHGRTTFITGDRRPNLFTSLEAAGEHARALELEDVDVKDLLETGRIVIERSALRDMIERHQSDLLSRVVINGVRQCGPPLGQVIVA